MHILDVEGRVVGTAVGAIEEHRHIRRQRAGGKTVVSSDLGSNVWTTNPHNGLIGGDHYTSDPASGQRACITSGNGDPVALGSQWGNGIGLGAIQDTATVVILDGDIGGVGCMHILDVEGRVVTAPGVIEEHGDVGG